MLSMIATVKTRKSQDPCVVLWTGKTGLLTGTIKTYCNEEIAIGDGVSQVPSTTKVCAACEAQVMRVAESYKVSNG